jgi:hypothetical protein
MKLQVSQAVHDDEQSHIFRYKKKDFLTFYNLDPPFACLLQAAGMTNKIFNARFKKIQKGTIIFNRDCFNLLLSALLFAGANFVAKDTNQKSHDIVEIVKEQGVKVAQKLFTEFQHYINNTDDKELREEDPVIVASQNSYDVLKYDLELSFNIEAKTISGELYMHATSINDTLSTVFINLYDNLKVNSVEASVLNKHLTSEDDIRTSGSLTSASFLQNKNYMLT